MIKKSLFLCLYSILTLNLQAQTFATNNTQWVFNYEGAWAKGFTEVYYEKDTLISNRRTKKFAKHGTWFQFNDTPIPVPLQPIYFYEKDGVVEFSIDELNFDTLHNFNAAIGDEWKVYKHSSSNIKVDSITLRVVDKFTSTINGQELASMAIEYDRNTNYHFVDTVYEQIGGKWIYLLPFDQEEINVDGGEGGEVRCFQNDVLGLIQFNNLALHGFITYDCNQLTSQETVQVHDLAVQVFPNPFQESLAIKNDTGTRLNLELRGIEGSLIATFDAAIGTSNWAIPSVPSGVYFLYTNGIIVEKVVRY